MQLLLLMLAAASVHGGMASVATDARRSVLAKLKPATGIRIAATPTLMAPNNQRYKGPLNSAPGAEKKWGKYEILKLESSVVAVHMLQVPNSDMFLYLERPSIKRNSFNSGSILAGTLNLKLDKLDSSTWTSVKTDDRPFCSGHTVSAEGKVVGVGGMIYDKKDNYGLPTGMQSIRVFDPLKSLTTMPTTPYKLAVQRWYPTATLLSDGQIMIMGGNPKVGGSAKGNGNYELYNPDGANTKPLKMFKVEETFFTHMKQMYYPYNFPLPTGEVYSFGNKRGRILNAQTGVYRKNDQGSYHMPLLAMPNITTQYPYDNAYPNAALDTQYPFTATPTYGRLTYRDGFSSVTLMVFGGSRNVGGITKEFDKIMAGRTVRSIKISWAKGAGGQWKYTFGDWKVENMGIPRVLGDSVLLPNSDVIVMNGAQMGRGTDFGKAEYPAFWAQLYQPDLPEGKRVSTLAGSTIARMYHSTVGLTTDAAILVSGCDICDNLQSDVPSYVPRDDTWEYRNEIFYPPYFFDTANKPTIVSVNNGNKKLSYGQLFTIKWSGKMPVTSVSLAASSSTSHSINANQRVIELEITDINYGSNTLTVRSPPNPFVAQPQYYMVFLMNGKTMSKAKWIKLAK